MSDNGKRQPIRAGQAFMAAVNADPQAQQALADTLLRLRKFSQAVAAVDVPHREAREVLSQLFTEIGDITNGAAAEQRRVIQQGLSALRAEQEQLFAELAREAKTSGDAVDQNLETLGFSPPANDLDAWAELARIAEKEPGPMTMEEIYLWAIAWAKRELLRRKMDVTASKSSEGNKDSLHPSVRSAEDASIFRDENDPRIAWCVGKRIYLGDDSQISRLFWLLASPVGRACTLAEVQRAVDGLETARDRDPNGEEYKKASQRVRKAISKLRAAIDEGGAADHLIIVRGGNTKYAEYSMVLRFGAPHE